MASIVEAELTSLAFCWRLERRDGVCLGFTTHDRGFLLGGLVYRAAPGLVPSAVSLSDGFEAERLDVAGALTSDAITEGDLAAGRWDGAAVRLFLVDWDNAGQPTIPLVAGELGDVGTRGQGFEAELKGMTALLDRPVVEQTSPECRAQLGDKRCRVDLAGRARATRVTAVLDDDRLELAEAAAETSAYRDGRLRWLTGANSGLSQGVRASEGRLLTLAEPPFAAAAVGDRVEIIEGCDKSFETCRDRFANGANFRGEPHLPGIDLLTRYPGV